MFCGAEASAPWKLRGSSPRSLCPSDDAVADEVFFPLESGYACTLAKVQGAELPAVAILCDVLHVPAAGYVAMSRVQREEDVIFLLPPRMGFFAPARR